ncbi:hypothetical protein CFAM422_009590 [Trichoderma lentiforme]|uniref:Uncharacterized protein n=1 Tax=Trichoderma lentiforme TaxID=1567552 RepID=A0A9P5C8U4_9HYPO|nr:hypothetical protein CFAM422_009590 [Trichoderma lentiforme]
MTELGETDSEVELAEGDEPMLTLGQLANIFKLDKAKREKEPNHITSTLARHLKSTYLEQEKVWK